MTAEQADLLVRVGDCPCPGTPHSEEHVYLEPELTAPMGSAMAGVINRTRGQGTIRMEAAMAEGYFALAIRGWTFLEYGEDGKTLQSVELTTDNINALLPWDKGGMEFIDRCDEMYTARLFAPFVPAQATPTPTPSEPGPTASLTSPTRPSGSPPPRLPRPSSPNGSDGKPSAAPAP